MDQGKCRIEFRWQAGLNDASKCRRAIKCMCNGEMSRREEKYHKERNARLPSGNKKAKNEKTVGKKT